MLSKRKSTLPQKASYSKRRELSWSMHDFARLNGRQYVLDIVEDDVWNSYDYDQNASFSQPMAQSECVGGDLPNVDADENLKSMLGKCDFYVRIYSQSAVESSAWCGNLCQFDMTMPGMSESFLTFLSCLLNHVSEFWLYVDLQGDDHFIYIDLYKFFETISDYEEVNYQLMPHNAYRSDKAMYFPVQLSLPAECFRGFQSKKEMVLQLSSSYPEERTFRVDMFVLEPVLITVDFPSQWNKPRRSHSAIQHIVGSIFNLKHYDFKGLKCNKKHNINELYDEVRKRHMNDHVALSINQCVDVQHRCLRPILRDYQRQAVQWMLHKERVNDSKTHSEKWHCPYEELKLMDGQLIYYSRHTGFLLRDRPRAVQSPPGGILADEMGLGKTVEVLACVLLHPRQNLPPVESLPVVKIAVDRPKAKSNRKRSSLVNESLSNRRLSSDAEGLLSPKFRNMFNCPESGSELHQSSAKFHETKSSGRSRGKSRKKQSFSNSVHAQSVVIDNDKSRSLPVCTLSSSPSSSTGSSIRVDATETLFDSAFSSSLPVIAVATSRYSPSVQSHETSFFDVVDGDVDISDMDVLHHETVCEIESPQATMNKSNSGCGVVDSDEQNVLASTTTVSAGLVVDCGVLVLDDDESGLGHRVVDGIEKYSSVDSTVESTFIGDVWTLDGVLSKPSVEVQYNVDPGVNADIECQCGNLLVDSTNIVVICQRCQSKQHANCVNYDLTDPLRGTYLCPHCHVVELPVSSAATLIIAPSSISHQWVDEVLRHIDTESIKVLTPSPVIQRFHLVPKACNKVYNGVSKQGYIQPRTLASQDIVITSYETLRKELDYVDLPHTRCESGRKFRNPKRFLAVPSPLVAVEWWRICLDEAQMVESVTAKSAEMALRLPAVNRWCVTGTPIQRGVDDLYGLLLFLGTDPYWVKQWWDKLLYEPFCYGIKQPLLDVVADTLWRTAKSDVLDQICLPPQTVEFHWLTFSPVEEHFYRQQYFECSREAMKKLRYWTDSDMKLNNLDKYTLHQLLTPLVRLRQACCHPQAVRGHFLPIQKSTMTMEELLAHLITKTRYDCEEAHRRLVFASTGLSGLHIIKNEFAEAVEHYREMLRSVEEHKEEIRTDSLQVLHIVHNLHAVLSSNPSGIGRTLSDSELPLQEQQIQEKYLEKKAAFLVTSQDSWIQQRRAVEDHQTLMDDDGDWWAEFLEWVVSNQLEGTLISKVREDITQNVAYNSHHVNMVNKFHSVRGLLYLLADLLQQLEVARSVVVAHIDKLIVTDPSLLVDNVVQCCLRPPLNTPLVDKCVFCELDEQLQGYESKLFHFIDKGVSDPIETENDPSGSIEVHTKRQGTWADSETEKTLRSLTNFAKNYRVQAQAVERGQRHLKLFDLSKKEFRCLRPMWMALRERVCAIDEINMATMRMRLRLSNELPTDPPEANIVEPAELETQRLKLFADRIIANNELRTKKGQLQYLKNLSKTKHGLDNGHNPELCPVCQTELGLKWSVLQCGHCLCMVCMQIIIQDSCRHGNRRAVQCPVCRQTTSYAELSHVSTGRSEGADSGLKVRGDHSTKVEGIVRCILKILQSDPHAKLLVFSSWQDVLDILAHALTENDIKLRTLNAYGKFEENLYCFKTDQNIPVLLLPVQSGANGLNLIEATHVLLVEPVLNRAQEYQAIGRVHRIGQTKPTVVHRFLVRGTIEERIFNLLDTVDVPTECHDSDQSTLTIGHLNQLFSELNDE